MARELGQPTAHAVALMSLYVGATESDDQRARALLEELVAETDGVFSTVGGFETLCGVLLALLETETGIGPRAMLQQVGTMIAFDGCLNQ
ncbi:MAG: hypothetical protein M3N98_04790 [Actinomycetota bacterium]|nr:hypothetical protein [Actinomycetota bacterium]